MYSSTAVYTYSSSGLRLGAHPHRVTLACFPFLFPFHTAAVHGGAPNERGEATSDVLARHSAATGIASLSSETTSSLGSADELGWLGTSTYVPWCVNK